MTDEPDGELLAEHEQRLRLVRYTDLDGTQHLAIEALTEGRATDSTRYADEDFPLAARDYDRRATHTLDHSIAAAVEVGLRHVEAVAAFDHEVVAMLIHDDFVFVEHRPIGYPDLDKARYLDVVAAQSDVIRVWLTQMLHAATSTAFLTTGPWWTPNAGQWSPFAHGVFLNVVNDGQIVRNEAFSEDQLDAALARFAELTVNIARA